jgi:DNA polymerase III delta subunit
MGSYTQWSSSKKVSTLNWVYGPELALFNDVSDYIRNSVTDSDLDRSEFDASSDSANRIWDSLRSASLLEESHKLVEIRNADKLLSLEPLFEWLAQVGKSPKCTVLMLSYEEPADSKIKAPKVNVIKCVMPKSSDRLAWVRDKGGLSILSAKRLLEHKNGNLLEAYNVCLKVRKLLSDSKDVDLSLESLKSLDDETPSDFVDALLSRDKARAFIAASRLPKDQLTKVLGSVDYNLRMVNKLSTVLSRTPKGSKIEPIAGFPMSRLSDLALIARESRKSDIVRRFQIVSMLDSYVKQGVYEGILETLVTRW